MREGGSGLFARVGGQVVGQRERRGGGNDGEEQRVQKFGVHDWILLKKFERKFFAVSNRSSTERIVTIAKHEAQLNTADGLRPGCAAHAIGAARRGARNSKADACASSSAETLCQRSGADGAGASLARMRKERSTLDPAMPIERALQMKPGAEPML